ncbi:hypothetical protein [Candidatus Nitrosocosmicus franklandus]|uniref:hypothetical protein n=1 Tax=Candidatus Nitrosocosmicus franklandianus TaxID=1798806 RepID=UPI00155841CA|nr:hypothetical protein [Candidatus Nitrosocosmicus franklandus]
MSFTNWPVFYSFLVIMKEVWFCVWYFTLIAQDLIVRRGEKRRRRKKRRRGVDNVQLAGLIYLYIINPALHPKRSLLQ